MSSEHSEKREPSYLVAKKGLMTWLITLDHKRIGLMYLVATLFFFLVAGLLAVALRTELFTPAQDFMSAQTYNKVYTLHGAIMVFLFIIPSVPAAMGNILLPLMLGARDVAFPRLNLLSFYIYCFAAVMFVTTLLVGSLDTGWTFYTPYSTSTGTAVIMATGGAFVAGFSSILTGVNFVVTTHKMRAPGLTWNRMPLMVWAIYATALIQVMATPVLAITLLLIIVERSLGIGIFDPALGGDPVLFQHFFWFYSHPAVYIMVLPGFGIVSELLTVHSRKHIFGYRAIALSSVAIAVISFIVWGHHMFVSGQSELAGVVFSFLTFAVAVPTAIKVFSWVATLYGGSIRYTTPMCYGLVFLWTFTIGGLTGLYLATLSTDVHLHDTYFVVAHFHYVMVGGTVIAFFGGLFHWWPKMFGRMYNEFWGRVSCPARVRRVQPDLLHDVLHGPPGHAASLLRVPARVSDPPPGLDLGLVDPGRRAVHRPVHAGRRAQVGQAGTPQPLGWRLARVEVRQLRRSSTTGTTFRMSKMAPTTSPSGT